MIISKKKYEKLNNELVDAKAKVDDAKKELDDENKIMRATLLIKEQRDQFKTENEKLRERNKKLEKRNNQKVRRYLRGGLQQMRIEDLENKYNGMIAERNSLIDDLSWYKAKVSRLERDNEQLKESRDWDYEYIIKVNEENKKLERENEGLNLMNESSDKQLEIFHRCFNSLLTKIDINKSKHNLLSEISQHIGNKPSSSTYKYFRAKLDNIGIKEGE